MTKTAKAYAKINLFLDITGKRSDGYHELDSVFESVSLYDEITLTLTDEGISVVCDQEELSGEDNIVYKACELFFEEVEYSGGAYISINKNIPVAAGLGGGSADAAAILVLLNEAFGNPIGIKTLCQIAFRLGADVPFCLIGGTARVRGIGEEISQVNTPELHYVLFKERNKQSTGKMFSVIDETEYTNKLEIENILTVLNNNDIERVSKNLFNAFAFCWDFEDMTKSFRPFAPLGVFLSGSGPTVGAIFNSQQEAENCAKALKNSGLNAYYARSMPVGVEIV